MKVLVTVIALGAVLVFGACSSGGTDPLATSPDGSSLSGQNLANATVIEDNSIEFYMLILDQLYNTYLKGLNGTSGFSSSGQTVNFLGNFSGNAFATADTQGISVDLVPELTIEYKNFSNTGRLFFAGTVNYPNIYRSTGGDLVLHSLKLNGTVEFAGDYAGSVTFENMRVGLEPTGQPVDLILRAENPEWTLPLEGVVIVTSGGEVVRFHPNNVDHPIPAAVTRF